LISYKNPASTERIPRRRVVDCRIVAEVPRVLRASRRFCNRKRITGVQPGPATSAILAEPHRRDPKPMTTALDLSRRHFMFGGASLSALALAGCTTTDTQVSAMPRIDPYYLAMYGPMPTP
jgi:hypothetical protein